MNYDSVRSKERNFGPSYYVCFSFNSMSFTFFTFLHTERFLQMFRRSKRDKERKRGSSFANDSSDDTGSISSQSNSLKRASKLFGFVKKDKRAKSLDNGSPDFSIDQEHHHIPIVDNDHRTYGAKFSPLPENGHSNHQVTGVNGIRNDAPSFSFSPPVPSAEQRVKSKSRTESESSSLSFDFGNDSSLTFNDFAADVLRATEEKLKGVDLKLPELKQRDHNDTSRIVHINRLSTESDFGFTIRRSTIENGIAHLIEPTGTDTLGLLPGDRILEVNDENVENFRRDMLLEKISNSGTSFFIIQITYVIILCVSKNLYLKRVLI